MKTKRIVNSDGVEREYIFFEITFNNYREISGSTANEILDKEIPEVCECVLYLPKTYTEDGDETPLILAAHGSGGRVCAETGKTGGLKYTFPCMDAGYAVLDVNGSALHGRTIGCPEHIFALYKAYRYATRHFNLSKRVLVWGGSMGGQVAVNFAGTFPSIVLAMGLFYPRMNLDGITVNGNYYLGSWDKMTPVTETGAPHDRIIKYLRFPTDEWCEVNTIGFNSHKIRSFLNTEGERVVIPPCPIKVWHGTEDQTVHPMISVEYVNSIRRSGSYVEFHLLEGVGHKANDAMKQELKLWFDRFI